MDLEKMSIPSMEKQLQKLSDICSKICNWIRELFIRVAKSLVIWIKSKREFISILYLKYKKDVKYQKRVRNRQLLYYKRKRVYGKS